MSLEKSFFIGDSILNLLPFAVIAFNRSGKIIDLNPRAEDLFKKHEGVGFAQNLQEFIGLKGLVEDLESIEIGEARSWIGSDEGFGRYRFHLVCIQKDKMLLFIDPLFEDEHQAACFADQLGFNEFLYQRVADDLRSSQNQLKLALDVGRMATWEYHVETDTFRRSVYHDELFGFYTPLGHWNFQRFLSLISDDDRERVGREFLKAVEGEVDSFNVEYRVVRPDQKYQWLELRAMVERDRSGRVVLLRGAFVDVTSLKNAELELQRALRIRDEFLGVASHELRNPVRTLSCYLQFASKILKGGFKAQQELEDALDACQRQTKILSRLIEDLLEVSRMMHGKFNLEARVFDFAEVLRRVVRDYEVQDSQYGCLIKLDIPNKLEMFGDPIRMGQVAVNLLSNAFRFGRQKPICIRLYTKDGFVFFEVEDNGPGIRSEDQERIFERFERASSASSCGGLGLGLYICKRIVEAHRGRIGVQSSPGKGARFFVELPQVKSEP